MLQQGDHVPHFTVMAHGRCVRYSDIWQRRQLLLLALTGGEAGRAREYVAALSARAGEFATLETELVVTADPIMGIEPPGLLVADRWGEVAFAVHAGSVEMLPEPDELVEWCRHLQHQCPECQGEAR